ncbi:MAG: AmmeMemoRadiSam system protein B [Desulfobulbaceae bacterium]|jgi:AmmeMemoRadiSam system protein B|nr:AmmeMemoRadiSam system protein B [Desulfobulbaceae bacterium]
MTENIRHPAVAGLFYPDDARQLRPMLAGFFSASPATPRQALALLCPHAGYVYSGALAAAVLAQAEIPERVILLGPTHHGLSAAAAASLATWRTPLGDTPTDGDFLARLLAKTPLIVHDEAGHRREHCLETQLPFLQYLREDLRIAPLLVSAIPFDECQEIAVALAETIRQSSGQTLIVASSDMSHYLARKEAARLDTMALERVLSLDPKGLYKICLEKNISMCGFVAVTIAMLAILANSRVAARLIGYTDSGAASGDMERVVAYAGVVFRNG